MTFTVDIDIIIRGRVRYFDFLVPLLNRGSTLEWVILKDRKILRVLGTRGTRFNVAPDYSLLSENKLDYIYPLNSVKLCFSYSLCHEILHAESALLWFHVERCPIITQLDGFSFKIFVLCGPYLLTYLNQLSFLFFMHTTFSTKQQSF